MNVDNIMSVYDRKLIVIKNWIDGNLEKDVYKYGSLEVHRDTITSYGVLIFKLEDGFDTPICYEKLYSATTIKQIRLLQRIFCDLKANYIVDNANIYGGDDNA